MKVTLVTALIVVAFIGVFVLGNSIKWRFYQWKVTRQAARKGQ